MVHQRIYKSSAWHLPRQNKSAPFASHSLTIQLQPDSHRPLTERELEGIAQFGHNFANIPIHPPGNPVSASVQPRFAIQSNGASIPLQLQSAIDSEESDDRTLQAKSGSPGDRLASSVQPRPNKTGLPDALKTGVENLSGYSLDAVRVHYNSPNPAQIQALAYTQGTEIHVSPGQEQHLPHEAWHVVQQMQGRVKPSMKMQNVEINNDKGLEREADLMGEKAQQHGYSGKNTTDFSVQEHLQGGENKSAFTSTTPVQTGAAPKVTQRFIDDRVTATNLNNAPLPQGSMYSFINSQIKKLAIACLKYEEFEKSDLAFTTYMRDTDSHAVYIEALKNLDSISQQINAVLPMIKDKDYEVIKELVVKIQKCVQSDYLHYQALGGQALLTITDVLNRVFKHPPYSNPYAEYPKDYITADNFKLANAVGLLKVQFIKWWRSDAYPGFNAEVGVYINGSLWAIGHMKWDVAKSPSAFDDPYMYNFKTPYGDSFPAQYSSIVDNSVKTYLLGACYSQVAKTQSPWQPGEKNRY